MHYKKSIGRTFLIYTKRLLKKHLVDSTQLLCIAVALVVLSGCTQPQSKLRIATAASMQYAMQELIESFSRQSGISCEMITGSSGKLTTQIQQGAPYDVFVAADMEYPNTLFKNNIAISAPKIYAYGALVLWSIKPEITPSIQMLCSPEVKHISLANPKTAPYGRATLEVLEQLALLDSLSDKLVYGESIAQASQFVFSQAAAIGFTAKSVVVASAIKDKGNWTSVNQKLYTPIAQGIVLLKNDTQQQEQAKQFYNFIFSDAATAILNTFGYSRTKP